MLRALDHSFIFILIAGTYTPFCLVTLQGTWGWGLFAFVWTLAIVGIICRLWLGRKSGTVSIIVYLLMCSLYESFAYPFIVIFSIPPALVGGVVGLRIMHTIEPSIKMDVIAMLGFIIMAGIVVNAAILLMEQALIHIAEGMHPQDAMLASVRNRLRPIFMTASSILGFIPLVASSGAGSELYRGMGAVQLGGMALSTIFTLVLVPTIFSLWIDARAALRSRFGKKPKEINGQGTGEEADVKYQAEQVNSLH